MTKNKKKEKTIVFGGMKWDVDKAPLAAKEEEKEPKKKKEKYLAPEFIFVFDDLGKAMRNMAIDQLVKTNRHFKMKVILSGQFILDISPEAIRQIDYLLIFGGIPREKLKQLHDRITFTGTYESMQKMYDYATDKQYNFLYMRMGKEDELRRNFNFRLDPTKF